MVLVVLDVVASATGESVAAVAVVGTAVAAAGIVGALLVSLFRVQFTQCTVSVQFLQVTV